jgi:type IV pilus assembly protein PilF
MRWLALVAMWWLAACATPSGAPAPGDQDGALPDSAEESDDRRRARIRVELAAGYYQQRNISVALDELRQAMAIDPRYAPTYGMLGLIYMDLGDRVRAEESFQRGLRIAPNDAELNNNYGWYLCQNGRTRDSIEYFSKAIRNPLYATPAKPLHNAGICSLMLGDVAAAEGYFQRAFQVDPRNAVAMFNLAEIYLKRRELERARFYSQRLNSMYDPSAQMLWLGLRIERLAGNRDAEASYGLQLRRRYPQSRETQLLLSGQYGE